MVSCWLNTRRNSISIYSIHRNSCKQAITNGVPSRSIRPIVGRQGRGRRAANSQSLRGSTARIYVVRWAWRKTSNSSEVYVSELKMDRSKSGSGPTTISQKSISKQPHFARTKRPTVSVVVLYSWNLRIIFRRIWTKHWWWYLYFALKKYAFILVLCLHMFSVA